MNISIDPVTPKVFMFRSQNYKYLFSYTEFQRKKKKNTLIFFNPFKSEIRKVFHLIKIYSVTKIQKVLINYIRTCF